MGVSSDHPEHLGELIRRRQMEAIIGEENSRSRVEQRSFTIANLIHAHPSQDWMVVRHENRGIHLIHILRDHSGGNPKERANVKINSPRFQYRKWVHLNRCKPWGNGEKVCLNYLEPTDNRVEIAPETEEEVFKMSMAIY
ncbi:hypothetical protein LOD99_10972 [Oopsacas minuta]|uniref:Uncharacterized protein n=1 Tax=Oopsacas minuta TaxID=111878 RepID=A0AAV7KBX6_9METZ|nr:hypothetical protein LOD99_10972 [Oopsacas minuta]